MFHYSTGLLMFHTIPSRVPAGFLGILEDLPRGSPWEAPRPARSRADGLRDEVTTIVRRHGRLQSQELPFSYYFFAIHFNS